MISIPTISKALLSTASAVSILAASGSAFAAVHSHGLKTSFSHFLEDIQVDLTSAQALNLPQTTEHLCSGYVHPKDQPADIPPYGFDEPHYGIDEQEFRARNKVALDAYSPITRALGGTLRINNRWSDGTVNANASKRGSSWIVNMYGGMARLKDVTGDGYNIVLCHEVGHLVGGFPFYGRGGNGGMADEGNSDYFAGFSCFYKLYKDDKAKNAEIMASAPAKVKEICNAAHQDEDRRNLCARTVIAGHNIQYSFTKGAKPVIGKEDPKKVSRTSHRHPAAQCRSNTTTASGTCNKPGLTDKTFPNSESEMNTLTCGAKEFGQDFTKGVRPRCWFAPSRSI